MFSRIFLFPSQYLSFVISIPNAPSFDQNLLIVSDRFQDKFLSPTISYLSPGGWQASLEVSQTLPVELVDREVPLLPLGGDVWMILQERI